MPFGYSRKVVYLPQFHLITLGRNKSTLDICKSPLQTMEPSETNCIAITEDLRYATNKEVSTLCCEIHYPVWEDSQVSVCG